MVSAFIQEKLLRLVVYYNSHSRALEHDHFASEGCVCGRQGQIFLFNLRRQNQTLMTGL
jgi:hypothetical protein